MSEPDKALDMLNDAGRLVSSARLILQGDADECRDALARLDRINSELDAVMGIIWEGEPAF